MEIKDINPTLVTGTIEYVQIGDVVKRKTVVEDQIILMGSAASLDEQIKNAQRRIVDLQSRDDNYYTGQTNEAKNQAAMEINDLQAQLIQLLNLWKESNKDHKDWPEK